MTAPHPAKIDELARAVGFTTAGIAAVPAPGSPEDQEEQTRFAAWIDEGRAGEMDYLKRRDDAGRLLRSSVRVALPWARSVIVCAANYNSAAPRSTDPHPPGTGWIARYAWSARSENGTERPSDYHKVLLRRLEKLRDRITQEAGPFESRCFVDTGPVVERVYARYAGIGWAGKNTCILNQNLGSWLFLGVIVTSLDVAPPPAPEIRVPHNPALSKVAVGDRAERVCPPSADGRGHDLAPLRSTQLTASIPAADRCGSCTRCIDACPTGALTGERTMDANRCIAYLTIEKRGPIPEELRTGIGRQVFGCDICQDVCPWNRRAPVAIDPDLAARKELVNPALHWLAAMDEAEFERRFNGSPVRRAKWAGFRRNLAIAMGNSGQTRYLPQLLAWSTDTDPVLADAAEWAVGNLRRKECEGERLGSS
jgi:epoxyqueuosine reductase